MRERDIEKRLGSRIRQMGGLYYKFTSPGNAGVPDRLIVMPGGVIWFVELKADSGRVAPVQEYQIKLLQDRGANACVVRGAAGVEEFLRKLQEGGA